MELIRRDKKGEVYQADGCKIFYRNKKSISGDNDENDAEVIYLITGSAEVTLRDKTWSVDAPEKIEFPANTYHKILALTDISFVVWER